MNRQNVSSVFPLRFVLLYVIWFSISVSKLLHFSRIIAECVTENISIRWYFPKCWAKVNTKRERKLGKFDQIRKLSFARRTWLKKLSFAWRAWLKKLKGFPTIWWKIKKKQGLLKNKYKSITEDAKEFTRM